MQKCKENIHVHQKCGKHHDLANSVMTPYFFIYANRNKAEPREVTKQVLLLDYPSSQDISRDFPAHSQWLPSYARTVCTLTLLAMPLSAYTFTSIYSVVLVF